MPRLAGNVTAGNARVALQDARCDTVENVYVVAQDGRFEGVVPLAALLVAGDDVPLGQLAQPPTACIGPDDDEEHVATVAFDAHAGDVAVVDAGGRLLGAVPATAVIGILRHEHVEDLRRLAGVLAQDRRTRQALEDPPARRLMHRLPWLLVGLAGSFVATYVMARFERVLTATVTVAFFVPAIVYLADAIGTQTEAAAVRFLSFRRPNVLRLLYGEMITGLMIGVALATVAFALILSIFANLRLALAVAVALSMAGAIATTTAILLPWLLWRAGHDPALGSGPLATIIHDVLSLLIYFGVVTVLLS